MSENIIEKIKIQNIEYELGTTISNVSGLQDALDTKATENFVMNKIAEAELSGNDVDLSGYATKDEIPTKPEDIGAQPAGDYALKSEIPNVPVQSVNGKTGVVQLSASDVGARPSTWIPSASDVGALPSTYTPPNQTAEQVGADPKGTAATVVSQHNTADDSHTDIRARIAEVESKIVSEVMTITQAQYDSMTKTQLASLYAQGVRIIAVEVSSSDDSDDSGNVVTYTNQMPISIDDNGDVYNGTGWKAKMRLSSSSGSEVSVDSHAGITGFMPVKAGDVVRFKDSSKNQLLIWNEEGEGGSNNIVYYDSSFAWLGAVTRQPAYYGICGTNSTGIAGVDSIGSTADGGIVTFTVPNNTSIAYVRITIGGSNSSGEDIQHLVVTVNEEIV